MRHRSPVCVQIGLDCYLLHWRADYYPLDDTVEAFELLKQEGTILSWGVSNFDVPDLKELYHFGGDRDPVCNQVLYHLQERTVEHAVIPWCEKHNTALIAYSPFGHGSFPDPHTPGGRLLQQIADDNNATVRQVALGFPAKVAIRVRDPEVIGSGPCGGKRRRRRSGSDRNADCAPRKGVPAGPGAR